MLSVVVEPVEGLVDAVPAIAVDGVPAGSAVDMTISTVDAAGNPWRSSATYLTSEGGRLRLDDPEYPWWSMRFADGGRPPVAFTQPDTSLDYAVEVQHAGEAATVGVRRLWSTGPSAEEIRGDGWRLLLYRPAEAVAGAPSILLIPGSLGPQGLSATAALLASHGHAAAVLVYMGEPGMPASLRRVPVESFHAAARRLGELPGIDAGNLVVYAASVGTTGAAYAFSLPEAPPLRGLVLVAGSHVIWQALADGPPPKESSFTYAGKDLPYVPIRGERLLAQMLGRAIATRLSRTPRSRALTLLPAYEAGLGNTAAVAAAAIPFERIACPLLTISGGGDAMWPASEMARAMHERRRGIDVRDVLADYPEAGHFLRPPTTPTTVNRTDDLVAGGTAPGWARAQRDAWTKLLTFLQTVG